MNILVQQHHFNNLHCFWPVEDCSIQAKNEHNKLMTKQFTVLFTLIMLVLLMLERKNVQTVFQDPHSTDHYSYQHAWHAWKSL